MDRLTALATLPSPTAGMAAQATDLKAFSRHTSVISFVLHSLRVAHSRSALRKPA